MERPTKRKTVAPVQRRDELHWLWGLTTDWEGTLRRTILHLLVLHVSISAACARDKPSPALLEAASSRRFGEPLCIAVESDAIL